MKFATSGDGWRLAKSLLVLGREIDKRFPNRDTASDGSIGDLRHRLERTSDHNPWIIDSHGLGVVRALDIDAGWGLDPDENHDWIGDTLATRLHKVAKAGHPAFKGGGYLIYERRICSERDGWVWRAYYGDSHVSHVHISVGRGSGAYDSTKAFGYATSVIQPTPQPTPTSTVYTVRRGDTLSEIAEKHHTTVRKIKERNHLRTNLLMIGQRLHLH